MGSPTSGEMKGTETNAAFWKKRIDEETEKGNHVYCFAFNPNALPANIVTQIEELIQAESSRIGNLIGELNK